MSVNAEILAAVKAKLEDIPNIGKVYARQRFAADWSKYLGLFKTTVGGQEQIRGWVVTLDENNPMAPSLDEFGEVNRTYNVLIWGMLGFQDASNTEGAFFDLCETIADSLDAEVDLGLSYVTKGGVGPTSWRRQDLRQFGSVLCHYAESVVPVETSKAVTLG